MKVAVCAVLLMAAYSACLEPSPQGTCQAVGQLVDVNCLGFFICLRAEDKPKCNITDDSGNPDYVLCFYPCRNGTLYDYDEKKCTSDPKFICRYHL